MKGKTPLLVVGALFVLLVFVIAMQPRPIDWTRTYSHSSDLPFGAEILATLMPEWLADGGDPVEMRLVNDPPFEVLGDSLLENSTYFFMNDYLEFDPDEAERLYAFAERGNTVLMATEDLGGLLADTLGLPRDTSEYKDTDYGMYFEWASDWDSPDSLLHLTAPALNWEEGYETAYNAGIWAIDNLHPEQTTILGTTSGGKTNLIRVAAGEGQFIISSEPLSFTNAALTGSGDGAEYLAGVLAYVPSQLVLWDLYYRPFPRRSHTPLGPALRSPALSWGLLLMVLGSLLFIIFRGRRWQRPVPVVAAPVNASVEFVRTVGRLYFQHGDGRGLVKRKLRFFFDRLRTRLALTDLDLSEETERRVTGRSGVPEDQVAALFGRFRRLLRQRELTPEELLDLDCALDRFYEAINAS